VEANLSDERKQPIWREFKVQFANSIHIEVFSPFFNQYSINNFTAGLANNPTQQSLLSN